MNTLEYENNKNNNNKNNNNGIKYFIYFISQDKQLPYIDTDIRKLIWYYANEPYNLILYVNNNIMLKLNIQI
jgi:hypothetical protein